jgi:hypothetical protein
MAIVSKSPNTTNRLAANPTGKHFQKAAMQRHFHDNGKLLAAKYHLGLSTSDQGRIVSAFELPAPASWALSARFSHFQRYSQPAPNRIGQFPKVVSSKVRRTVD